MEKKFFYDNFTEDQICGLFSVGHILSVIIFFVLAGVCLYYSRKFSKQTVRKLHIGVAITVVSMEVIKIGIRIYKGLSLDSWIPLYYCSLFLYAIVLALSKNEFIKNIGMSFVALGGTLAAFFFTLYPSTSLALFPIWHPASIHSFIYHFIMFYTGCLFLITGYYVPKKEHSLHFFILVAVLSVPSVILNHFFNTNCMFMRDAFGLGFLQWMIDLSPYFYMAVVFIAQSILVFWFDFGLYKLITDKIQKKKNPT